MSVTLDETVKETGREKMYLSLVESVRDLDLVNRSVLVLDLDVQVLTLGKGVKTEDGDLVRWKDSIVVCLVREPERKHTPGRLRVERERKKKKVRC